MKGTTYSCHLHFIMLMIITHIIYDLHVVMYYALHPECSTKLFQRSKVLWGPLQWQIQLYVTMDKCTNIYMYSFQYALQLLNTALGTSHLSEICV